MIAIDRDIDRASGERLRDERRERCDRDDVTVVVADRDAAVDRGKRPGGRREATADAGVERDRAVARIDAHAGATGVEVTTRRRRSGIADVRGGGRVQRRQPGAVHAHQVAGGGVQPGPGSAPTADHGQLRFIEGFVVRSECRDGGQRIRLGRRRIDVLATRGGGDQQGSELHTRMTPEPPRRGNPCRSLRDLARDRAACVRHGPNPTHSSPAVPNSFFQIGTVFLSRLMPSICRPDHLEKAARRHVALRDGQWRA